MRAGAIAHFGPFEFVLESLELRRGGRIVPIEPKPAALLAALLERPGEVIGQADLRARLWPGGEHLDYQHGLRKCANKLRDALDAAPDGTGYIETLHRRGYRFNGEVDWSDGAAAATPRHTLLAVLPFESLAGHKEGHDYAEGLTEQATARLGSLLRGGLRVLAATSARRYRDSPNPLAHITRELGVDYVLTGRLRPPAAGAGATLSLELIATQDESLLWTTHLSAASMAALQFEFSLAEGIAGALALRLRELPSACRPAHPSAPAWQAYLRGRRLWHERSEANLRAAIEEFRRAIHHDPGFALPYVGLAESYFILNSWGSMAPKPAQSRAQEAAAAALELNPCLAGPYLTTASSRLILNDDWAGAETSFHAAISRNPSYATAHEVLAFFQITRGVFAAGLNSSLHGIELDPLSAPIRSYHAYFLLCAGHQQQAVAVAERCLDLYPNHLSALAHGGVVLAVAGRVREAILCHQRACKIAGGMPSVTLVLAASLGLAGESAATLEQIQNAQRQASGRYLCGYFAALAYACLGDHVRAIESLEHSFEERDPHTASATVDPRLARLRADPASIPVMQRIQAWIQHVDIAATGKEI